MMCEGLSASGDGCDLQASWKITCNGHDGFACGVHLNSLARSYERVAQGRPMALECIRR